MGARDEVGRQLFLAVIGGDVHAIETRLAPLEDDSSQRNWICAIRSAAYLVAGALAPAQPEAIRGDEGGLDEACAQGELLAFLSFDGETLGRWHAVHEASGGRRTAFGRLLVRAARGELDGLEHEAADLEARAARDHDAAATVDAASLRAIVDLAQGAYEKSIAHARRASRMARTEGLPAQAYLANLCLARARRWQGRPSLATHILGALARSTPAPWWGWIEWERLLAGGLAASSLDPANHIADERTGPAGRAARGLAAMLRDLRDSTQNALSTHASRIEEDLRGFFGPTQELKELIALLDPARSPDASLPPLLSAWQRGALHHVAPGYPGVCMPHDLDPAQEQYAIAWVVAGPGTAPRRVPRAALAMVRDCLQIAQSRRRTGREDTALAVLALAGEPVPLDRFFLEVYGFAYVPPLHEGVLRVLFHRLRTRLPEGARIVRHDGSVALELDRVIACPDPRCSSAADERILLALAREGSTTAKELAETLRIPLRTVQSAIRALVEDGACRARTSGRRVEYVVEDTTFTEATRH